MGHFFKRSHHRDLGWKMRLQQDCYRIKRCTLAGQTQKLYFSLSVGCLTKLPHILNELKHAAFRYDRRLQKAFFHTSLMMEKNFLCVKSQKAKQRPAQIENGGRRMKLRLALKEVPDADTCQCIQIHIDDCCL